MEGSIDRFHADNSSRSQARSVQPMILHVDPRETSPLPSTIRFVPKVETGGKSRRDDRGATGHVIGSISSWTIDQRNRERERAGASCQTSPPVRVANERNALSSMLSLSARPWESAATNRAHVYKGIDTIGPEKESHRIEN